MVFEEEKIVRGICSIVGCWGAAAGGRFGLGSVRWGSTLLSVFAYVVLLILAYQILYDLSFVFYDFFSRLDLSLYI